MFIESMRVEGEGQEGFIYGLGGRNFKGVVGVNKIGYYVYCEFVAIS